MRAMHDGIYCSLSDHWLYTTFKDALWDALSGLLTILMFTQYSVQSRLHHIGMTARLDLGEQAIRGTQVRTIKDRTDNDTQVKIMGEKSWDNRNGRQSTENTRLSKLNTSSTRLARVGYVTTASIDTKVGEILSGLSL